MTMALEDFTEEFIDHLKSPSPMEIQWAASTFQLAPNTRIVRSLWDWDRWLKRNKQSDAAGPEPEEVFFLLYLKGSQILTQAINPFAALVLQTLEEESTLEQVVSSVISTLEEATEIGRGLIQERVLEQLKQAYHTGFIRCPRQHVVMVAETESVG